MNKKEFIEKWGKQIYDGNISQACIIDGTKELEKYLNGVIHDELIGFAYWVYINKIDLNGSDDKVIQQFINEKNDTEGNKQI